MKTEGITKKNKLKKKLNLINPFIFGGASDSVGSGWIVETLTFFFYILVCHLFVYKMNVYKHDKNEINEANKRMAFYI